MILASQAIVAAAHNIADTVGLVVSVPLLLACLRGIWLVAQIKTGAEETNRVLTSFTGRVTSMLDDHEDRIRESEGKVTVLWDGHERRRDERRNTLDNRNAS